MLSNSFPSGSGKSGSLNAAKEYWIASGKKSKVFFEFPHVPTAWFRVDFWRSIKSKSITLATTFALEDKSPSGKAEDISFTGPIFSNTAPASMPSGNNVDNSNLIDCLLLKVPFYHLSLNLFWQILENLCMDSSDPNWPLIFTWPLFWRNLLKHPSCKIGAINWYISVVALASSSNTDVGVSWWWYQCMF